MPRAAAELAAYLQLLELNKQAPSSQAGAFQEVKTSPLFTWPVKTLAWQPESTPTSIPSSFASASAPASTSVSASTSTDSDSSDSSDCSDSSDPSDNYDHVGKGSPPSRIAPTFTQYTLMGTELPSTERPERTLADSAVFLNTNAPWSAFICGSQGSGKSYTMSCMLENCLMNTKRIGKTSHPLSGIVFAYDAHSTGAVCEAAYLATNVPVNVLVSPSNYRQMHTLYNGIPNTKGRIKVHPLFFKQEHLNTQRMMRLMAFNDEGSVPLYMEVIIGILKEMAISASGNTRGFNYQHFRRLLDEKRFDGGQKGPLSLRLSLLDAFMDSSTLAKKLPRTKADLFRAIPGTLTVVDLTDAFVDPASACVLFDICLSLFLEDRSSVGKVIALDEAHKFMGEGGASEAFTQNLLTVIREQRHKGARIIIATQEPTVSPKLLDLCSITIVHRFTSPEWLRTLQQHIAGASEFKHVGADDNRHDRQQLFTEIVNLDVGESLLFSPSAMLDVVEGKAVKLGTAKIKFRTRLRISADGGRSVMAA